jgi:SAM-dependent methyltransferase
MDDLTGELAEKAALYYDLFTDDRGDVDFFIKLAREYGGPVLEVGCGTGRVTNRIAEAGVSIDGLDLSAEKLQIAEAAGAALDAESRARVRFFRRNMQDFDLQRRYKLAIFPFRVLQELTSTQGKIECLRCVHAHLEDGGRILIDNFDPSVHLLSAEPGILPQWVERRGPDGELIRRSDRVVSRDYANQTQKLEVIYDVEDGDGRDEHLVIPYQTSYIFRFELEHLLARCGFDVRQTWGGYSFEPFGTRYPGELIMLAERADNAAVQR